MVPLSMWFSLVQDKEHILSLSAILTGSISIKRLLDTACEHAKKDIPNRDTKQRRPSAQKAQKPYCSWRSLTPCLPTYLPTYHSSRNLACIALLDTGPKGPVSSNNYHFSTVVDFLSEKYSGSRMRSQPQLRNDQYIMI